MPGYRERTILLEFPELGDDCTVTIRNPLLLADDLPEWANMTNQERARQRWTRMILKWNVWDPETDEPLPLPTLDNTDVLGVVPAVILRRLSEEWQRPLLPKAPPTNGQTVPELIPLVAGTTSSS